MRGVRHISGMNAIARKLKTLANLAATLCPFPRFRLALFRFAGIAIGEDTYVNMLVRIIIEPEKDATVVIGRRNAIAPGVVIAASSNPNQSRLREFYPSKDKAIVLEDDVWIGANATILPGVHIGRMSVVAVGAVEAENVEAGSVVGGIPARVLKKLPVNAEVKGSL